MKTLKMTFKNSFKMIKVTNRKIFITKIIISNFKLNRFMLMIIKMKNILLQIKKKYNTSYKNRSF